MRKFKIGSLSRTLEKSLKLKIDFKTKPLGALGQLENIALQIGLIQNSLTPQLKNPHIVVFAADHGIAKEGVSAYPQEVTHQMVLNFLSGGAAINVFCKLNNINLTIVDAGVNFDFPENLSGLVNRKISNGTNSFLNNSAMSLTQAMKAIDTGAEIVKKISNDGCNVIGFGEMGIGNTTAASALLSVLSNVPAEQSVGKGTGIDDEKMIHKMGVIKQAIEFHGEMENPLEALATFGGFEIAQMAGAMLQAAELGMIILVDGFISTSAFLVAYCMEPRIKEYALFCHHSEESGHKKMLDYIGVRPLVNLNMRLGEGTGAAIAYPLINASVTFLNEMASFESAGVSQKEVGEQV